MRTDHEPDHDTPHDAAVLHHAQPLLARRRPRAAAEPRARSSARGSSRSCSLPVLVGVAASSTATATSSSARRTTTRSAIVTFLALISLGWQFARDIGRALGPTLFRRMDPGTAGTVGFLLRLATMLVAVLIVALRIAGLGPRTLALGGAVHRGRRRSRGAADARQPVRRHGAAQRAAVPGRRAGHACRAAAWPGRSRASSAASACSTRRSPPATTRSWSRTRSC